MSKMNELKIAIVLKVKQIQNMHCDEATREGFMEIRQQEIEQKMEEFKANPKNDDQ